PAIDAGVDGSPGATIDAAADLGQAAPIDAGADAARSPDANPNLSCNSNGCTAEQNQVYDDCVFDRCDAPYQMCFGAGYRSGTFSGPCGSYVNCLARCSCNDTACRGACGTVDTACQNCLFDQLVSCVMSS